MNIADLLEGLIALPSPPPTDDNTSCHQHQAVGHDDDAEWQCSACDAIVIADVDHHFFPHQVADNDAVIEKHIETTLSGKVPLCDPIVQRLLRRCIASRSVRTSTHFLQLVGDLLCRLANSGALRFCSDDEPICSLLYRVAALRVLWRRDPESEKCLAIILDERRRGRRTAGPVASYLDSINKLLSALDEQRFDCSAVSWERIDLLHDAIVRLSPTPALHILGVEERDLPSIGLDAFQRFRSRIERLLPPSERSSSEESTTEECVFIGFLLMRRIAEAVLERTILEESDLAMIEQFSSRSPLLALQVLENAHALLFITSDCRSESSEHRRESVDFSQESSSTSESDYYHSGAPPQLICSSATLASVLLFIARGAGQLQRRSLEEARKSGIGSPPPCRENRIAQRLRPIERQLADVRWRFDVVTTCGRQLDGGEAAARTFLTENSPHRHRRSRGANKRLSLNKKSPLPAMSADASEFFEVAFAVERSIWPSLAVAFSTRGSSMAVALTMH